MRNLLLSTRMFCLLAMVLLMAIAPGCAHGKARDRGGAAQGTPQGWPVEHPSLRISSRFGDHRGGGRSHKGIDLEVPMDTPVRATAGGMVTFSGDQGAYGQIIVVEHGQGIATAYAHLSKRHVRQGDHVRAGDVIGKVGRSGNATAPHCHYEVRRNGLPVNPEPFLD